MNNGNIHTSAIIEDGANIDPSVIIGPYSIIGSDVIIGKGTKIESHVCIAGNTIIGENNHIFPFASIGYAPQDMKYQGEKTALYIGNNNIIREYVTIHPGTDAGIGKTEIKNNCLVMISCHIAHDCLVGNNVIMANSATLAGHVQIQDHAIIGGLSAIKQNVIVGKGAIVGGMSGVEDDVLPYANVFAKRARLKGVNLVGLRRSGIENAKITELNNFYRDAFFTEIKTPINEHIKKLAIQFPENELISQVVEFALKSSSICSTERKK